MWATTRSRAGRTVIHCPQAPPGPLCESRKTPAPSGLSSTFSGKLVAPLRKAQRSEGAAALEQFSQKWDKRYPHVSISWKKNWSEIATFFKYPPEIRRIIYTTNPIEGFHRQVRKYTKSKGAFTSENALVKLIYSAYKRIKEKWYQPIANWALIISQLDIYFEGRLNLEL